MKNRFALAMAVGLVASCLGTAWSFPLVATDSLTNYDRRVESANQSPAWSPAQARAVAGLKSRVPGITISRDQILGTPRLIAGTRGFLTGPGGTGLTVSGASLAAFPADDEQRVIKAFLNEHSDLFGHDAGVLASARVQRDYVTAHNGLHTTIWEQRLDDIPVFEALLVGHVTRDGELVSVSSHFVPDAARAADSGTPNRRSLASAPAISAARGVRLAAANIGVVVEEGQVAVAGSPQGAELSQAATAAGLFGPAQVQLTWLPMNREAMRLCWRVILGSRSTMEHFLVLVDAETGELMVRHGLTTHIQPATYNVYTNESPTPFSPGYPTPSSVQPTNVSRVMVKLSALDTNASPAGWVPDGLTPPTSGNNVTAFVWRNANTDVNGNPIPDGPLPRAGGGTNRVFDFSLNLGQDPANYGPAATVNMFYRCNWYHDRLYQLGFTEAAGNFQVNNFGRGGFSNDNVIALVQGEANLGVTDNAFFSTLPDGMNGYVVMFVWDGTTIKRDGDLDASVICHEMTHGLSNRLLGGGVGIFQLQTEGMGEGWSDFFALCLLSNPTNDVNANYPLGGYVTYFPLFGFTENYYYGIRRYPYSTDMTKNPLTFKDIDPTKADPHSGVLQNPFFGGGDPSESHNSGEVWCVTLHEMWASLVAKSGWTIGNQLAMQLVVDSLKLAPANATFLEARDAIIEADALDTGGDNFVEIWTAFAKRGMGFSAQCPTSDTTTGVIEAYDVSPDIGVPDGILELKVTPASGTAMFAGETNTILVRVSDSLPVTNATITATISGGTSLVFRNDGVAPDQMANNSVSSASLQVPTNQPIVTITLVVSAPGKDTATNVVTYFIIPVPPNDYFTNATKVPVAGTNYFTNNKRATLETNEPVHANVSSVTASLWWNYTPAVNTNVLVDTGGSDIRTVVAVYTNQTIATLQPVVSAAGTADRPSTFVKFNGQAGRTYHIAVAGYDAKNVGTLNVNIVPGVQPDTNAPTVTITSPLNGQIVTTNRIFLTGTAVDPSPNPSGIKTITVRVIPVAGLASTTVVAPSLGGPTSTNWSTIVGLLPGVNDVQVTVTDYAGNVSDPASIEITYRVLDPVNDFFANAIVLTGLAGTNSVNTVNATKEAGEPNHAGVLGGKSAWWFYTPPTDGVLTLSTINSSFDTVLAMYTGPDVSHLTPIASNDDAFDGAPGGYSQIVQGVRANQPYRIAVDGFDGAGGLVFLSYSFTTGTVYHVTVNSTAGGFVTPASADVQSNGTLIVTATPNPYFQFDSWDGAVVSSSNPLSVVVNSNLSLTAHFVGVVFTDDFESGGLQHIAWITNGPAVGAKPWFVQTNVVAAGQFAARSGFITDSQTSSLLFTGTFRDGTGSFDYRVSSELNFDTLKFLVDGVQQQQWSGDVPWANFALPLTAGTHTLEWRYSKDASGSSGFDAAFIDNVNLPLGVGIDSTSAAHLQIALQNNGTFFINLLGQTNQQYVLQVSTNLFSSWQNLSTNIAVNGVIQYIEPVAGSNAARFYRAVVSP